MKTYLKLTPFWLFSLSICARAHAAEVPLSQCTVPGAFPLVVASTTHDDAITYEQAFVDRMVDLHDLSASEWSNGWGWETPLDPDLPFGRMINALRLLHGAARVGVPQDNIVYWAGDYVEKGGARNQTIVCRRAWEGSALAQCDEHNQGGACRIQRQCLAARRHADS